MSNDTLPASVLALCALKGQIATLTSNRTMKHKKGILPVQKVSTFQCRIGVNYDNIAAVKVDRANGDLPSENQGLIGRSWVCFPYLMRSDKSGKYLFRCTRLASTVPTRTTYLRNGQEISKEEALIGAYASEMPKSESPEVFDVTVNNLTHINGVPV